jgi:hypothetical protein
MYMSMNHIESIQAFKKHVRQKVKQFLNQHSSNDEWTSYFWTYYWYRFECGGLATMFVDPWHIFDDGDFSYDGDSEFIEGEERIINIGAFTITNENEFSMDLVGGSNENSSSNVPMERALACFGLTMQEITEKYR